jgi:regulator of nucleoside diphosphate kinase
MKNTITGPLILSEKDYARLQRLADPDRLGPHDREEYLASLGGELGRARVVPAAKVPPDVVTMGSTVRLLDLRTGATRTYTLVYPGSADISQNRISVLAPVGTAIVGQREGDTVEWSVPSGLRRLRIEEVVHQPERATRGGD